jgi:hypothetical protein
MLDNATSSVRYTSYTRDDTSLQAGPNAADTLHGEDKTNVLLAGVFVQDKIVLGKLTLLPGARLDVEYARFLGTDTPALALVGPSARIGASYAPTRALSLHAYVGYLWQPPNTIDGVAAARVLVPSLAGQALPVDLKAEKDWTAELGITAVIARWLSLGLTGWGRLVSDQLDRQLVGNTNLMVSYNFARGRAAGVELSVASSIGAYVDAFGNVGWQLGQGQGVESERFLFTPAELADKSWQILDHVQTWTSNVGVDAHDKLGHTHLSALFRYGSGLRTGATNEHTLPQHATVDLTLRHRFVSTSVQPEVAVDILNLFNDVYAYRLATGNDGSAWAVPRSVLVRVSLPWEK